MKELVEFIAKSLVDNPDEVKATETAGEQNIVVELSVAGTDRGKVIGKEGRIIKAIRTIAGASAAKLSKRAAVEIVE